MQSWNRLGRKKQNQILMLVTFGVVGMYLLLWHWGNYQALTHTESMVSRAENRLQLKTKEVPKMPESSLSLEKKYKEMEEVKAGLQVEYQQLSSVFMPLNDIQVYQNLQLGISDLAEVNRVRIQSVSEIGKASIKQAQAEREKVYFDTSNQWGRPLLKYQMNTRYGDLMAFLRELDSLTYQVSPVNIQIEAELADENAGGDRSAQQYLNVMVVLAL
ncbi:hypothetical protein [Thiomicrorhabdus heinhorstiae]|uniref:Uncharacterized protein n=1 Tax=Thiomicrorhabdus heinhorstiae TaxID=2748010 RepID=A0ABS0BVK0_9GAMM|nr:hypothetical protein [Thiomicrorhabdus heinhorstiae]MBF6057384.1 hypothetical protein [Thiomicrorhabdus heinhorstiae]